MKFSEKLQKLRKENGMSQEDLADKLDVSRQSVSKWESGQTYPEMDKLLTMCKIFNITLDDLTNDDVKYNEVKTKTSKGFSNIIDDIVYIIDKTYNMFKNMSSKERGKCIGELIILFIILLILKIPFMYISDLGSRALNTVFGYRSYLLSGIWDFIINIIYFILFVFTYVYIYKTYYLDKYKPGMGEESKEVKIKKEESTVESNDEKKEEVKVREVVVKEKRKIGSSLFVTLSEIVSFLVKGFLIFMCIPFIISFVCLFIIFIIMAILLFKGIFYFGFLISIISGILLNVVLLKLLLSFIFNYKLNFRIIFITFLVGLSLVGIGFGISIIDIAYTEILDELPENSIELTSRIEEYDMVDNLVIDDHNWYSSNVEYVVDNSLTDTIKLELTYYNDVNRVEIYKSESSNFTYINAYNETRWNKKILNLILNNLKDKKIYDYDILFEYTLKVYTSESNIDKIKENYKKYYDLERKYYEDSYSTENNLLRSEIDELNIKINEYEYKNSELEVEKEELKAEIEKLKNKIDEYKNSLNLLD